MNDSLNEGTIVSGSKSKSRLDRYDPGVLGLVNTLLGGIFQHVNRDGNAESK